MWHPLPLLDPAGSVHQKQHANHHSLANCRNDLSPTGAEVSSYTFVKAMSLGKKHVISLLQPYMQEN